MTCDPVIPVPGKLISRFLTGSHLYGTSTELSDEDERGVFIPCAASIYGFIEGEHHLSYLSGKDDIAYYSIQHFFKLALTCNPTIIEMLFIPPDMLLGQTWEWQRIQANRHLFLSRRARRSFKGYAYEQLARIRRHRRWLLDPPKKKPEREDFGLPPEKKLIPSDQVGAFNSLVIKFLQEVRDYHQLKDDLLKMEETHNFHKIAIMSSKLHEGTELSTFMPDVSQNFIHAIQKEGTYKSAKKEWDSYQQWKKSRNPERAVLEEKFGYDTKHASHLFRLLSEGQEMLETGHLTLPRPDADEILKVKNGHYSYDVLMQTVDHYDTVFDRIISPLPNEPAMKEANQLCIDLCRTSLENG